MFLRIKELLESYPQLYVELLRIKRRNHWSKKWVVTKETDCVIDGFPRSANSFARLAFVESQVNNELILATHTHSPAQIVQAARWGIPTMVCIRRPFDAIRGLASFDLELVIRDSTVLTSENIEIDEDELFRIARRWFFFLFANTPL